MILHLVDDNTNQRHQEEGASESQHFRAAT